MHRDLTQREYAIIKLLVEGLVNKEIAERLGISYFTVKTHTHNIYWKKNLKNRAEFLKWYYSGQN